MTIRSTCSKTILSQLIRSIGFIMNQYQVNSLFCSFLLHGDSFRGLANRFRMSPAKVHQAVSETCQVIAEVLTLIEMAPPTEDDWIRIEKEFYKHWNFPNCIRALDGKHVVIQAPGKVVASSEITRAFFP